MKRIIVFLTIMLTAMTVMAQQKVAILETVDKAQNVTYGIKLLLRSSLTAAISNTPGYEGYDRVDMASIAGEQEFQRTGSVSDDQIRKIGIAAGASYVLVAEAAKYDATSIIITAKLLDVETFGVKNSVVLVSGVSSDEMQKSCKALASQLLNTQLSKETSYNQMTEMDDDSFISEKNNNIVISSSSDCPNKVVAGVLDIVLGTFGAGHFYTGQTKRGIWDAALCWTGVPTMIGLIEGIIWLCDSKGKWEARCIEWNGQ